MEKIEVDYVTRNEARPLPAYLLASLTRLTLSSKAGNPVARIHLNKMIDFCFANYPGAVIVMRNDLD